MKLISLLLYSCISRCICILGTLSLFLFRNNRQGTKCWRSFDWSYKTSLGLFPRRMSIEYAIAKTQQSVVPTWLGHGVSWYFGNVFSGEKSCFTCCKVSKFGSVFKLSKILILFWMMIIISNEEHCYGLFELFLKDTIQSQMQSKEMEIEWQV